MLGKFFYEKSMIEAQHPGRKLFDGKDESLVLQKLEEAFVAGATDAEA